jgi:hypothetical protein
VGIISCRKDSHRTSFGLDQMKSQATVIMTGFLLWVSPFFSTRLLFRSALSGFSVLEPPSCQPVCLQLILAEFIVPRPCGSAVILAGSCFHHQTNRSAFYLSLGKTNIQFCSEQSQVFFRFNLNILLTPVINMLLITRNYIIFCKTGSLI